MRKGERFRETERERVITRKGEGKILRRQRESDR